MNERQNMLTLNIDGDPCRVPVGISVAAALSLCGDDRCRLSISHQARAPFCGMGICQECRVTINGLRRLACQTLCQAGMRIERSDDE
ncbi:(2Fe-2S)-binding protein [Serratia sp. Lou2A]|uniref:2Fe-2S iron-sulfur cluster protein n=2 Tax=Serratia TaxID=613 RepID=A0AA46QBH8_SERMA|nr:MULTISPECIES: (2Fe-2S)-binding protein [Serratia]MBH3197374.1 (2Fe-2S)-binding protein [Serratia marcescens]MCC7583057.1 (2Fe-2S)-binding protein [Serratia sp. Lou2A]MCC7659677.1 (2Fe-2S)-binding protein [Serratia sp. Pon4B]TQI84956.1 2Fe-2S iron-sulfur cluster protein [Serratia marcescens]HEJ6926977.1 (2Fe-2S)-binding protein [Serratia marcescens]